MQKYYIRNYGSGNYDIFEEEDYNKKIQEELEELKELNDYDEIDEYDYELDCIVKFDNDNCNTIEDAVYALWSGIEESKINIEELRNVDKNDIIKDSSISCKYKTIENLYINIVFEIVEIDEEDIYNSKIKNTYIEFI